MSKGTTLYRHQDQLGSTILTGSASGEDRKHVDYDAFGQVLSRRVPTPGHTYNGKPRDPMTGLVNYGFRDYDPRQGRFTTIDPIRSGENWYGYVSQTLDPINSVDWLGLDTYVFSSDLPGGNKNLFIGIKDDETGEVTTYGLYPSSRKDAINTIIGSRLGGNPSTTSDVYKNDSRELPAAKAFFNNNI